MTETSRVAIVTGGGRGIGAATALELARQGWDVAIAYREQKERANGVATACETLGRRAITVATDVAVEAEVESLFATVDRELGVVGALVNNAGIVASKARVDEIDSARVERLFVVNVVSAFLCAREAVRRMSTNHGGCGGVIVNVGSAAARLGGPGEWVDYAATKGAIDTMTVGLAREVASEGIRVNGVRPGLIATELHASAGQPDRVERMQNQIPLGRAGEAAEVAAAIAWLCSDAASYVTGSILDVSGGR